MRGVMRRLAIAFLVAAAMPASAHGATLGNWDRADQRTVARAGVLPKLPGGFHGERRLRVAPVDHPLTAIARRTGAQTGPPTTAPTLALFHPVVVNQLGLADLARRIQH